MLPLLIPAVVGTSLALMAGFATSVLIAGVATTSFLVMGGLAAVGVICTSFVLMASFAVSVFLAGLVAVCTPFMIMASFAVSAILAGLGALSGSILFRIFLIVTSRPDPLLLVFMNRAPLFRGISVFANKLTFLGVSGGARAASIGSSVTAGLAQFLRVKKKLE